MYVTDSLYIKKKIIYCIFLSVLIEQDKTTRLNQIILNCT